MASIRKRNPGQWEVRIRKRGYPTACKTFASKAKADAWAKEVETAMNKNQFVSSKESEQYTLAECLERYINEYVPRLKHPETVACRARALQKRPISRRIMATIRARDVADYRRDRETEGLSGATILAEFAILSRLFNLARSDWGMENLQNPVNLVSKPKAEKGRERRLEAGEEEKLLQVSPPDFRPVILFALATAMRREEIATLKWKNVNLEKKCALLLDTKNTETRSVPLSPAALDILRNIPRREGRELVFGLGVKRISKTMLESCRKAGLENLRFHDLRHEAISRLFEDTDLDIMEIRTISGHKTLQMLLRYTHLRTARLADRLAGARREAAPPLS